MNDRLKEFGIKEIPFEAAGTGFSRFTNKWLPDRWKKNVTQLLDKIRVSTGAKSMAIVGEYGTGKTYLLKWIEEVYFKEKNPNIKTFYFDNPGVQFYDLANSLLADQIGREEFAKGLYELVHGYTQIKQLFSRHPTLFEVQWSFSEWAKNVKHKKKQFEAKNEIAKIFLNEIKVTDNGEIANKIASILVNYYDKPYFDYRDFTSTKNAIVAKEKEAMFFKALIRLIKNMYSVSGIAFLIDEFEEIALQKRLSQKAAAQYLYTLKRLINLSKDENFWILIAMTPYAVEFTKEKEPALWQRFTNYGKYEINFKNLILTEKDAYEMVKIRLNSVRINEKKRDDIFPFPENYISILDRTTYDTPRKLVKFSFYVLSEAIQYKNIELPFTDKFIIKIQQDIFRKNNSM